MDSHIFLIFSWFSLQRTCFFDYKICHKFFLFEHTLPFIHVNGKLILSAKCFSLPYFFPGSSYQDILGYQRQFFLSFYRLRSTENWYCVSLPALFLSVINLMPNPRFVVAVKLYRGKKKWEKIAPVCFSVHFLPLPCISLFDSHSFPSRPFIIEFRV